MTSTVIVQRTDELSAEEIAVVEASEMTPDPDLLPLKEREKEERANPSPALAGEGGPCAARVG